MGCASNGGLAYYFTGSGAKPAADAARQLACEHTVSFDAVPERVPAIHAAGLAACTLFESRIDGACGLGGAALVARIAAPWIEPDGAPGSR